MRWLTSLALVSLIALTSPAGTVDVVTTDVSGGNDFATAGALGQDGKLTVAVAQTEWAWARAPVTIVRLDQAGRLDPTFGVSGQAPAPFTTPATVVDLLPARDGRTLVIATVEVGEDEDAIVVARLQPDGSLDGSFGKAGRRVVGRHVLGANSRECGAAAGGGTLDFKGRVIVAGTSGCGGEDGWTEAVVVRLTAAGDLDTTFARDGAMVVDDLCGGYAVAAARDGSPLVAGSAGYGDYCADGPMAVVRLRPDGRRDGRFGRRGRARVKFPAERFSAAEQVAIDRRGRIVLAGQAVHRSLGRSSPVLARLTASGRLDRRFGNSGRVRLSAPRGDNSLDRLIVANAGQLVVAGESGRRGVFVARTDAEGHPDRDFGDGGIRTVAFGGSDEHLAGLGLTKAGEIVVVAASKQDVTGYDVAVVRLQR